MSKKHITVEAIEYLLTILENGVDADDYWRKISDLRATLKKVTLAVHQPEPGQEPVAWCQLVDGKVQDLLTSFEMKDWLYDKSWIPLYTTPPKLEPLSKATIEHYLERLGSDFKWDDGFEAGVKWAEKAHGITGDIDTYRHKVGLDE